VGDGGPFGVPLVVVFGLFSAAAWGGGDFAGGLAARRAPVFGIVLGSQAVGMVLALVLAVVRAEPLPAAVDVAWSSLAGICGAVGLLALYHGLAVGRISVVAPVTGVLGAGVPVLIGVLLEGVPPPAVWPASSWAASRSSSSRALAAMRRSGGRAWSSGCLPGSGSACST
jgi:uncharacterized membrane protein